MLAILLWTLAALVLLILVLLFVPWHLHLAARSHPAREVQVSLRLISAGLPPVLRVRPGSGQKPKPEKPKEPKPAKTKKPGKPSRLSATMRRRAPRLIAALPGLVADTLAGIHLDRLHATGRFGLGDPAETGQLFGQLCPLIYALPSRRLSLDLTPDFDRACLEGEAELALHLTPARLARPTLALLLREALHR